MAKEQKTTKYHKRRTSVFFALLVVLLGFISVVLACTVFFRVEEVVVEGNERYTQEEILAVADIEKGSNLPLAARELIQTRICEALPYIESVETRKHLPTTLKLVVKEAKPLAAVAQEETGAYWLLDAKARLLEQVDESATEGYAKVVGMTAVEPQQSYTMSVLQGYEGQLEALIALLHALQEQDMGGKISEIDVSSPTEVVLLYEGRLRVTMLINADFSRKMIVLSQIVDLLGESRRGTINLKTTDAYYTPEGG